MVYPGGPVFVVTVREDHTNNTPGGVVNTRYGDEAVETRLEVASGTGLCRTGVDA